MKPINEPYTLSGTAALNEAQVLGPFYGSSRLSSKLLNNGAEDFCRLKRR